MPDDIHKRQRVSKACEQCRRKKVKCDGKSPVCGHCQTLGLICTYKESTKKRGPPKGYIEAIEGRLHRLENLLGNIIQQDDPRSQAIMAELNAPLETAYGELIRPRPVKPSDEPPSIVKEESKEESNPSTPDEKQVDNESNNDNIGNLSIDESGQLRYYGKSSGYYMLSGSKNFQDGAFHFNSRGYRSHPEFQQGSPQLLSIDPFQLPPQDLSDHLLDLYFTHFYPLLPLLHKKTFMASLQDPAHRPPPLLLNSIYAVASRISTDPRVKLEPNLPDTAGDIFLERARILLNFEWDGFKVSTVQSLLLLSSHQNGALKNIRGWLYSGLAFRMCQNLGLNRNCDSWNLSSAEKEERKRVFYCCFVVDRLSCAMHGRAPMIDERDYDTPYPSEVDDDDKTNSPTIIENFHQLIKLCEILGDILCQLYMVKGRKHIAGLASPDPVISKLDKSLNKWMEKLPPNVQYKPPNARIASAPTLQLCQVHMLFYTTLILLHRPFIPGPTQKHTPSVFPSASICTFAASKILDIVECLLAEGRLKMVNNYALYFMFTAGIIFINDALSSDPMFAFEAKININKIIRAMDEVETTWITSARHCNILGELAGLRDINLENVDEGYQRTKTEKQPKALSIVVPNSPVLVPSPLEFRNPIDAQRGVEQRFPEYITQLGRSDSTFTANSTSTTNSNRNINVVESPVQYNTQASAYTATPPINTYTSDDTLNRPFDPIGSAFWDVPASFDIDEWDKYLSNQSSSSENQSIPVSSMIQGSQQSYAPMMNQNNNQRQMW